MKNKKGLSSLIIVVVIVVFLIIALFVIFFINNQPKNEITSDEYSGWKSFSSDFGGLSFYYPNDWSTSDISSTDKSQNNLNSSADKIHVLDSGKKPYLYFSTYTTSPTLPKCDVNTSPGTISTVSDPNNEGEYLSGCPEITILNKYNLPNLKNLYYVEALYSKDLKVYVPVCGISSDSNTDIIKDYSYSPWFVSEKSNDESNDKKVQFLCKTTTEEQDISGIFSLAGSKEQASSNFKKEPLITIKKIMLSLSAK